MPAQLVPILTAAGATVLVTFGECCGASPGRGYAPRNRGRGNARAERRAYSHPSVLAAVEDACGLPLLGGAAAANPLPVR